MYLELLNNIIIETWAHVYSKLLPPVAELILDLNSSLDNKTKTCPIDSQYVCCKKLYNK